jgi:hypothetical protein
VSAFLISTEDIQQITFP